MNKPSGKQRRVLFLTWSIRNGIRVAECREYLRGMGLNEYGRPLTEADAMRAIFGDDDLPF